MTTWIITTVLAGVVGFIVYMEIRHGRRARDFFEGFSPEIEALNNSVARKYRAKFGKDPTHQYPTVDLGNKP